MTVQKILEGDIPELRRVSDSVSSFDQQLITLLEDLHDTLRANRGLDLSAPQIGVHQRVFVVDIGEGLQELINPVIVETSGQEAGYESCLSFRDYTLKINRPTDVTVEFKDRTGQPAKMRASGLLARVICHEVDHLNGILFMDHLSEEELFYQLVGNAYILEYDEEPEDMEEESNDAVLAAAELKSLQQDLQLCTDMLSEMNWKLALSLDILKDYESYFEQTIHWHQLHQITQVLDETIEAIDARLEQASSPSGSDLT